MRSYPAEYTSAEEVKAVAEKAGFWPTSPRIPLHVELKDYAHWYGNTKATSSATGILTFVAHILSKAIEQPVLPGTLKRVLKHACWIAVFDGLDEVPHDVKDDVAHEVMRFINEVAVTQQCDLLSICTSRPQGYSGQFQELDCAVIELSPLSTDTALKCARPVISFQRSRNESERAIAVLEAAASSSSVRDLLTTPLQVHILAVVVRDGERPPDRRWKLYDRFYDVIRRREANRNLPDARLARLLREDEKLPKTLHSRIGFRLHADAETSEGAETSLDKDAFRVLANRTVAQMEEDQFDEKVEVLDKATTERLVLINTPESGSKLRFDVRQLQEFFAAECLYDSAKTEDVRSRIAVIAGDAHWREVTHFLLSSLVENDRSTELSVAIEELSRQNEGDAEGLDGSLFRRAGKGAIIAARLLNEGVLEQDKSTRQRFRSCLTPAAAFANIHRLYMLIDVHHTNSRTWLINFLFDKLRESAYAENIGAAITLCHTLPDGDSRIQELTTILDKAPGSYIAAIIDSFVNQSQRETDTLTEWLSTLLLRRLTSPNWDDIGVDGIRQAALLITRKSDYKRIHHSSSFSQFISLLEFLTVGWIDHPINVSIGSGNITLLVSSDEPSIAEARGNLSSTALTDEAPGVLRLVQLALILSESPSRFPYCAILRSITAVGLSLLASLFKSLQIPIPHDLSKEKLNENADLAEAMSEEQFTEWLEELNRARPASNPQILDFNIRRSNMSEEDFVACFEFSPTAALELLAVMCYHGEFQGGREDVHKETVRRFIPRLLVQPALLANAPSSWEVVLEQAGADANALRDRLFEACRTSLPYKRPHRYSLLLIRFPLSEVVVSLLRLFSVYREGSILPYLADLFFSQLRVHADVFRHAHVRNSVSNQVFMELNSCRPLLRECANDVQQSWSIRCSAALLLMTASDDEQTSELVTQAVPLFVKNCNSRDGAWLLNGLVIALSISGRKQTPALTALMRDLFESCREDYRARASLEQVLISWRESSTAPVTRAGIRDKWLFRSEV